MNHDFLGDGGAHLPKYDSVGKNCTDIGAVMDYFQVIKEALYLGLKSLVKTCFISKLTTTLLCPQLPHLTIW